ncbi:hypothetical protein O1L55_31780 [Streptomyces albulus]|nr:hypothetical protein [Streptomyces noursei]
MQQTTTTAPPAPAPAPDRHRIRALDALRGFALCGILLVNVPQITVMAFGPSPGVLHPIRAFLDLTVQERFFPIFSFLFGISFALFLDGAARRSDRPRLLLVRRLVALGLLGRRTSCCTPVRRSPPTRSSDCWCCCPRPGCPPRSCSAPAPCSPWPP